MGTWKKGWYYLLFGSLFFFFWLLFKLGGMPDIRLALVSTTIDVVATMTVMVVTVEVLLPRLLYRKKNGLFFSAAFALIFLGGSLIILSQLRLFGRSLYSYQTDLARSQKHYFYWFWADLIFGSYFMTFFLAAAGAAVRLAFDRLKAVNVLEKIEKERVIIEKERVIIEKERVISELESLKHQINPHFLFNALNTIYYKIDRSNGAARETLQRFSHMLRHQLYECSHGLVDVETELMFIGSYIALQQERLNENYTVSCSGFDEVKGFSISPFLLMPIVENCFKHVSNFPERENIICIQCQRDHRGFTLYTGNSTSTEDNDHVKGIGLENVRRRLALLYAGKGSLTAERKSEWYEVTLQLEIE